MTPAPNSTDPATEIRIHTDDTPAVNFNPFRLGDYIGGGVRDGIYDGWGFGDRSHMVVIQNDCVTRIVEISKTGVQYDWSRHDWSKHNKVVQDLCKQTGLPLAAYFSLERLKGLE